MDSFAPLKTPMSVSGGGVGGLERLEGLGHIEDQGGREKEWDGRCQRHSEPKRRHNAP